MLWSNNNCCLGNCSHNYQFIYCCYGIAIANEASAFNLTFMWTQFEFVSLWRRGIILLTLLSLKQPVNQLHLNDTIDLTISQLVFSLAAMFESNQTWCMKRILLQYIVCADSLCNVFAWSGNNQDLCLCLQCLSLAFSWVVNSWTLPLYGFDCGSWVRVSLHCKKLEFHHQQDDYACVLLIIASDCCNHFSRNCSQYAISLPYWESRLSLNVMSSSQSDFITIKFTSSAKHHLDRKKVNNCTINIVSYSAAF